jgi:hypothetical protein
MDHVVTKSNLEVELGEAKACCFEGSSYADLTVVMICIQCLTSDSELCHKSKPAENMHHKFYI